MKPEKLVDDRLEQIFAWMARRGGPGFAEEIRNHIAALKAEAQNQDGLLKTQAETTRRLEQERDTIHATAAALALEAEAERSILRTRIDELGRQGQADHRALHDALGWAHGWHNMSLPPPWRAVTALIAERDAFKRDLAALRAGWPPSTRAANQVERCGVYGAEAALSAIRQRAADEKRMVTVQPSHVAGLVARVIDRILGANEGEGAQSPEKGAAYAILALPADEQADALVSKWCAEQQPATVRGAPDAAGLPVEPTAKEVFAKVREPLEEYRRVAEQMRSDPGTWSAGEGLLNLALLERRTGAMERAIREYLRVMDEEGAGTSAGLRAALTDASPAPPACTGAVKCDPETPGVYECGVQCSCQCHASASATPPTFTLEEVRKVFKARLHHKPLSDAMKELAALCGIGGRR